MEQDLEEVLRPPYSRSHRNVDDSAEPKENKNPFHADPSRKFTSHTDQIGKFRARRIPFAEMRPQNSFGDPKGWIDISKCEV